MRTDDLLGLLTLADPVSDDLVSSLGPDGVDLLDRIDRKLSRPRRAPMIRTPRMAVPAAAAAVVTLIAGLLVVLIGRNAPSDVVDEPTTVTTEAPVTTTTAAPTTTTTEPTTTTTAIVDVAAPISIRRATDLGPMAEEGAFIQGMAAADGLVFALGANDEDPEGRWIGRIWVSEDGDSWTSGLVDGLETPQDLTSNLFDLASNGTRLVAVGLQWTGAETITELTATTETPIRPLVLVSNDRGVTWTIVDTPDLEDGRMLAVTATPEGGFLAVGDGVYRSDDGTSWEQVSDEGTMWDVTRFGDLYVAAGQTFNVNSNATFWYSEGGDAWIPVRMTEQFGSGIISWVDGLAGYEGTLVASGVHGQARSMGDAASWTSTNGKTWVLAPKDQAVLGGAMAERMRSVVDLDGVLVGLGDAWKNDTGYALVWTSSDGGEIWARFEPDGDILGQRYSGTTLVMGGVLDDGRVIAGGEDQGAIAIWVIEPTG
jgi:hypothetical protein